MNNELLVCVVPLIYNRFMSFRPDKENPEGLSNQDLNDLIGPRGFQDVIELIADPEKATGVVNPVRTRPYYDTETRKMRVELDSRGIGISYSLEQTEGVERMTEPEFEEATRAPWVGIGYISHNRQSNLRVHLGAFKTEAGLFLKTRLMPNEHGIEVKEARHYKVDIPKLPRLFRDPHPAVPSILGINFDILQSYAVVGLINE